MSDAGPRYFSRREIRDFLEERSIALKKRWGQNFLCDPNVLRNIVSVVDADREHLWEIGPGLGVMTAALLARGHRVTAFEIDWGLVHALREIFADEPRLQLVGGDVVDTWRRAWSDAPPAGIVGNLPYRSSQTILAALVEAGAVPGQVVVTLQREVAERALASSGSTGYSAFTVLLRSRCEVQGHFHVSGECFYPKPEVASTVIELRPRRDMIAGRDLSGYAEFVQGCFRARRKTLLNNLKQMLPGRPGISPEQLLHGQELSGTVRPEELSPDRFFALYRAFRGDDQPD